MLLLTVLVVTRSQAAFTATTSNTGNSFGTAEFLLTDDDNAVALFTANDMAPGETRVNCIKVTYTGTATPTLNFFAENVSAGLLPPLLDVTVDVAPTSLTGGFADCAGFVEPLSTELYSGPLSTMPTAALPASMGTLTTVTDARVLRFTVTVDPLAPLDTTASADFVWEAFTV